MQKYNPKKIEGKWQKKWQKSGIYKTKDFAKKPKFYVLDFFPYPSGDGLHVGHVKGYSATDAVSRMKMMQGFNILHPMGWDAFGLPAENYAIKNKIHPRKSTEKNIANFKKQLKKIGFTYDWSREIGTIDPDFYKWTQWIFLKMFEKGLVYESEEPVNWCPSCKTVLANEDLEKGLCERCGTQVVQKKMRQWVLKITAYADRLLYDLDRENLDWEELIVEQQKNWIGRSEGAAVKFQISKSNRHIEVFTTRIDTIFGCTYCVVAPEHKLIQELKGEIENYPEVEKYIIQAQNKTVMERTELAKGKTGVELKGIKAVNPFTGEEVPVWAADYVLGSYGTGAVMAVPAHDERDFEFAKKYNLSIKQVVMQRAGEPHKDEVLRKVVAVIVHKKSEDKYLLIKSKKATWTAPVVGGIEEGETPEEAAKREVYEETGYRVKDVKKIGGIIEAHFFSEHYNIWRKALKQPMYCEIENDIPEPTSQREMDLHEVFWASEEEALKKLTHEDNKQFFARYLSGNFAFTDDGVLMDSGKYTGLTSEKARQDMIKWLEEQGMGGKKVNYKMRDWVFSRQRYWGEPIPIIHCEKCGVVAVPEKELPLKLPDVKSYEPTGTGESPLANIKKWVNVKCPKCKGPARRETNTMPQWAGSSWYYLRYIDPKNKKALVDKKKEKYWMPVDLYVGGAEHATRHLLYARFWHKFLYDIGAVSTKEPFKKLVHVGLISGEDGRKMSKRWGNIINPDDVVAEYGADTLRLYEMFMGPFTQGVFWNTKSVNGMKRFLDRAWNLQTQISKVRSQNYKSKVKNNTDSKPNDNKIGRLLHKTIKKVTEDIEGFKFNTAISSLMIMANELEKEEEIPAEVFSKFVILLSPFAPHMSEEMWSSLGRKKSIFLEKWPEHDPELAKEEEIQLVVQVNGKVRDKIMVKAGISEEEAKKISLESEKVKKHMEGKSVRKMIFVKGRLMNIVI